jgi:ZIP family zinc transporter
MVFFFKSIDKRVLDGMLGFAAGVMVAASFWSLLAPSIELYGGMGFPPWLPAVVGFLLGGLFLAWWTWSCPPPHRGEDGRRGRNQDSLEAELTFGPGVTLHNIRGIGRRSGLRGGGRGFKSASFMGAVALAMGIGCRISRRGRRVIPLRREGLPG